VPELEQSQGGCTRHASRGETAALFLQHAVNVERKDEVRLDDSLEVECFGQPRVHQGSAPPFRSQEACIG
jgi:hypothetical protein